MDETRDPIEKLREELKACGCDPYECVSCSIPRKVRKALEEIEAAYMKLPVDADGVPIRPGDMLTYDGVPMEVMAVGDSPWFDRHPTEVLLSCEDATSCRHVKPDTVFDILEELALRDDLGMLSLVSEKDELDELLAGYAERIRKACNG